MSDRFSVGRIIERREVPHGQVWLSLPVRVIADDEVLAVWVADGTPFTFPPHPFGPHPWSGKERWTGCGVLQVQRPGEAHAVWGFFHGQRLDHWYVNFQAPYRRLPGGFDTLDHGVDIVVSDDRWMWKDRDDVAAQVASGRLTPAEADAIWVEANRVAAELDRGHRWWLPRWSQWEPS
jgi:hypothetical protein